MLSGVAVTPVEETMYAGSCGCDCGCCEGSVVFGDGAERTEGGSVEGSCL